MGSIAVEHTIWIAVPCQRVWQAITNPQELAEWWPPDHWDIPALEVGTTVAYGFGLEVLPSTIVAVDPLREFSLRAEPCAFHPNFVPLTTFRLSEARNGTYLTINQSGFEGLPDPCRHFQIEECVAGFQSVLENLKFHLEACPTEGRGNFELTHSKTRRPKQRNVLPVLETFPSILS